MNKDYSKIFKVENPESNHSKFFPKNIFLMCCGKTGCGKTNLLLNLLLNGKIFYNDVCIFCPTIYQEKYHSLQNLYKEAKIESQFFRDDQDIPDPESFDPSQTHIMVFDDVMNKKQNKIVDYFCQGRHNNFNVFYLAQSLYKTQKHGIRDNCNMFILFKQDKKTLKSFYDSHVFGDMDFTEFEEFCHKAWSKDFGYVVINLWSKPTEIKYIDSYEKIYIPQNYI